MYEIRFNLPKKTPDYTHCYGGSIVVLEQVNGGWVMKVLLTKIYISFSMY